MPRQVVLEASVTDRHGLMSRGKTEVTVWPRAELPPVLGVQFHGIWDAYWAREQPTRLWFEQLETLAAAGVTLLRVDAGWDGVQPENVAPEPAYYYNRRIARMVAEAKVRGMQVLLTLHQCPKWARPKDAKSSKVLPARGKDLATAARFLAFQFSDLAGIEVWNEPNLKEFTGLERPRVDVQRYVDCLKVAYEAVKSVNSGIPVLFGGPSHNDFEFIDRCYTAGAGGHFDVMSTHPYTGDGSKGPEEAGAGEYFWFPAFDKVLQVMAKHKDGQRPVWFTELGWSVHGNAEQTPPWQRGVPDHQTQAAFVRQALEMTRVRWPQVRAAIIYCAHRANGNQHGDGYNVLDETVPRAALEDSAAWSARFPGVRRLVG